MAVIHHYGCKVPLISRRSSLPDHLQPHHPSSFCFWLLPDPRHHLIITACIPQPLLTLVNWTWTKEESASALADSITECLHLKELRALSTWLFSYKDSSGFLIIIWFKISTQLLTFSIFFMRLLIFAESCCCPNKPSKLCSAWLNF